MLVDLFDSEGLWAAVQNICRGLDTAGTRTLSSFDSLSINLLSHVCCGMWTAMLRWLAAMAAGNEVKWLVFGELALKDAPLLTLSE